MDATSDPIDTTEPMDAMSDTDDDPIDASATSYDDEPVDSSFDVTTRYFTELSVLNEQSILDDYLPQTIYAPATAVTFSSSKGRVKQGIRLG